MYVIAFNPCGVEIKGLFKEKVKSLKSIYINIGWDTFFMVWNWIFERLLTPERVTDLIKKNQPAITSALKDSIVEVLEDEDIAKGIIAYTDGIYGRYLGKGGKLWSTIGGVQKGINTTIEGQAEQVNPLLGLFEGNTELSLSGLVKGVISKALSGNRGQQRQNISSRPISGTVPNM